MPLKMKSKGLSKFVLLARDEYAVIQLVGYKSRKRVTRELGSEQNVHEGGERGTKNTQSLADACAAAEFRVRSINMDNGSEFINCHQQHFLMERYKTCEATRSHPNLTTNNARIEERNLHVVWECVGYERLNDERYVRVLKRLYKYLNLSLNHFQTWTQETGKERRGSKVIR